MKRRYFWLLTVLAALVLVLIGFTAYSAYDFYRYRPERIQRELLGRTVARGSALALYQPDISGFGYGTTVWEYRLNQETRDQLSHNCISIDRGNCILGAREDGSRYITIFLKDGNLRVEEWWH